MNKIKYTVVWVKREDRFHSCDIEPISILGEVVVAGNNEINFMAVGKDGHEFRIHPKFCFETETDAWIAARQEVLEIVKQEKINFAEATMELAGLQGQWKRIGEQISLKEKDLTTQSQNLVGMLEFQSKIDIKVDERLSQLESSLDDLVSAGKLLINDLIAKNKSKTVENDHDELQAAYKLIGEGNMIGYAQVRQIVERRNQRHGYFPTENEAELADEENRDESGPRL